MISTSAMYALRTAYEKEPEKFKSVFADMPEDAQKYLVKHWYFARCTEGHMTRLEQIIAWHEDWFITLWKPGRRWGKTYAGGRNTIDFMIDNPGTGVIAIASTFDDAKTDLIEGKSGILKALQEKGYEEQTNGDSRDTPRLGHYIYICSRVPQVKLDNGSLIRFYTASKGTKLRGKGVSLIWADELLTWFEDESDRNRKIKDVWDQIIVILSEAKHPKILITSTPTPILFLRDVLYKLIKKDPYKHRMITGSLMDNPHLSDEYKETVQDALGGTRKGNQEIDGNESFEVPGALWKWKDILRGRFLTPDEIIKYYKESKNRTVPVEDAEKLAKIHLLLDGNVDTIKRIVVGVDPAVSNEKNSDETGIVVACSTEGGKYGILHDASAKLSTDAWSREAIEVYHKWDCDVLIYEKNNGGDLILSSFRTQMKEINREERESGRKITPKPKMKDEWASRGKQSRAEGPALLYEKHLAYHIGTFPALEEQMTTYDPAYENRSPDRMDGLVWALINLSKKDKLYFN
jgi:phage terminase large subunit-like protein